MPARAYSSLSSGNERVPAWSSTIGDAVPAPEASGPPPPSSPRPGVLSLGLSPRRVQVCVGSVGWDSDLRFKTP